MTSASDLNLTTDPVELEGVDPADPPCEQLPGRLWHGGCPVDYEWVRRTGIDTVIDAADEDAFPPPGALDHLTYLKCPLVDDEEVPDPGLTLRLAALVGGLLDDGRHVFVHCTFGRNRSGLLVTLIIREVLRVSGRDALAHVQAHRRRAVNNVHFAAWLRSLPPPSR